MDLLQKTMIIVLSLILGIGVSYMIYRTLDILLKSDVVKYELRRKGITIDKVLNILIVIASISFIVYFF